MNDLELLRDLRADTPAPSARQLAAGRSLLLAGMAHPAGEASADVPHAAGARKRWAGTAAPAGLPRSLRFLLPAATAAAAAATVGAMVLTTSAAPPAPVATGAPSARPGPGPGTGTGTGRVTLAAQFLDVASTTVARERTVRPSPGQWFHETSVVASYGHGLTRNEDWTTFDARLSAYYVNGALVVHNGGVHFPPAPKGTPLQVWDALATPLTAFDALDSLPSEPSAVLAAVDRQLAALGPDAAVAGAFSAGLHPTHAQQQFDYLADLVWNAHLGAPPAALASVYRAMATIPGIVILEGITNVVGKPAVGLSADSGLTQLLLDPRTYQVIGMLSTSPGPNGHDLHKSAGGKDPRTLPPRRTVLQSLSWTVAPVTGPGRS